MKGAVFFRCILPPNLTLPEAVATEVNSVEDLWKKIDATRKQIQQAQLQLNGTESIPDKPNSSRSKTKGA